MLRSFFAVDNFANQCTIPQYAQKLSIRFTLFDLDDTVSKRLLGCKSRFLMGGAMNISAQEQVSAAVDWHYTEDAKRIGPVSEDEIVRLLQVSWSRLSEQIIRFDKWNLCRG